MAKVTFIDPIKSVSGKFSKKHCVVHCIRQAATNNPDMIANPQYTNYRDPSKKVKLTAGQMAWNEQFGIISKATRERMENPAQMNTDRLNFAKQSEYKTLYSYVWNLVKEEQGV